MRMLRLVLLTFCAAALGLVAAAMLLPQAEWPGRDVAQGQDMPFPLMPAPAAGQTGQSGSFAMVTRRSLRGPTPAQFQYSVPDGLSAVTTQHNTRGRRWHSLIRPGTLPAPVVILLHGAGRKGLSMIDMWQDVARQNGIVLIAPDSQAKSWDVSDLTQSVLEDMLTTVSATRPIDRNQIYLFGHSDGAIYAAYLINRRLGPWRAAALHAGFGPAEGYLPAQTAKPIRLYLGDRDHIFVMSKAEAAAKALARAGHAITIQRIPDHTHWFYAAGPKIARDAWQWFTSLN